jgi:hypothetical protein
LPPGAERTVQYADYLGSRASFVLVTIPSEVARGVVARSADALAKGSHRVLGYVENMSGYYCRDCQAVKPLFPSSDRSGLDIPCLGSVPFDPELARLCDSGIPSPARATLHGQALDRIADTLQRWTFDTGHCTREAECHGGANERSDEPRDGARRAKRRARERVGSPRAKPLENNEVPCAFPATAR